MATLSFSEIIAESLVTLTPLTWKINREVAVAHFFVGEVKVAVSFEERPSEWQVSFDVVEGKDRDIYAAFHIFNGVFQAVEEFLEVRTPMALVFATKREDLANIYETYLRREGATIERLGYRLEGVQRVEPSTEYVLRRTIPDDWNKHEWDKSPS